MRTVNLDDILQIIVSVTGESLAVGDMNEDTALLGAMPEIDSMAIINIILGLEQRFGFQVDDEEVEQSIFETVGSLLQFSQMKLRYSQVKTGHG